MDHANKHCIEQPSVESVSLTFDVLPTSDSERARLGRWFKRADFQTTGLYARDIDVMVILPEHKGVTVQLLIGTSGYYSDEVRVCELSEGVNRIKDSAGGLIWLRAVSDVTGSPARRLTVTFSDNNNALVTIPVFRKAITDLVEWRERLQAGAQAVPVQIVSDRVILTVSWESVLSEIDEDPDSLLDSYANVLDAQNEIASIGAGESPLPILISEIADGAYHAMHYGLRVPKALATTYLRAGGVINPRAWNFWHELSRMQLQIAWSANTLTDKSPAIYTLATQRYVKIFSSAVTYDKTAHECLTSDNRDFDKMPPEYTRVMWEQLRRAFGDAFFHRLHVETRINGNSTPGQGDAQYRHYFLVTCCKAAHANLIPFFDRWGWQIEARTLQEINSLNLPEPSPDPSTLHLLADTYINLASEIDGYVQIAGSAHFGSRIKTTNDPQKGWYDPEDGPVYASTVSGWYVLKTKRRVNNMAVTKSFDHDTGAAISESNYQPIDPEQRSGE